MTKLKGSASDRPGRRDDGNWPLLKVGDSWCLIPGVYDICIHMTKDNLFFFFPFALLGFALSKLICNQGTTNEFFFFFQQAVYLIPSMGPEYKGPTYSSV